MKGLLTVLLLFFVTSLLGQGFTYSYVDPCSKKLKTLYVNNNQSVTINYLGQTNSFTQQDFTSGAFDNWISTVQSQASSSPCDEVMTYQQKFQNMVVTQNLISTLTSVTATSTMNMSNALGNSVSNSSSNSESKRKDKQQDKNNGTTISNNTPSGNIQNSSTTQSGTVNSGGNQNNSQSTSGGGNSSGETNPQNAGNTPNTTNPSQGGSGQTEPPVGNSQSSGNNTQSGTNTGQGSGGNTQSGTNSGSQGQGVPDEPKSNTTSGGNGGTTNSISNASGNSKVKVGSVIGTGDIVAIRSNEDGSNQFKGTMSVTKANTNNTLAKGALLTFTTSINNSNLTLYGAFTNKKKTNVLIVANSSMLDFDKNFFNTTTALESKKFGNVSLMAGANFTVGGLYGEPFSNLSAVGGGFVPFKVNKKINGNILLLGVYSPFTKFYEGKWWNSGLLVVPFSSWDYTISKSFKYNISFSGTYEVKGSVLQYQILTGGKILL